jgi:FKBP12-rapamycin complex-associated protein
MEFINVLQCFQNLIQKYFFINIKNLTEQILSLFDILFYEGLNNDLIKSLSIISDSIPELLSPIQEKVLDFIHYTLTKIPLNKGENKTIDSLMENDKIFALKILSTFNMKGQLLQEFINDFIVKFLYDENSIIRKEAAIACCKRLIDNVNFHFN